MRPPERLEPLGQLLFSSLRCWKTGRLGYYYYYLYGDYLFQRLFFVCGLFDHNVGFFCICCCEKVSAPLYLCRVLWRKQQFCSRFEQLILRLRAKVKRQHDDLHLTALNRITWSESTTYLSSRRTQGCTETIVQGCPGKSLTLKFYTKHLWGTKINICLYLIPLMVKMFAVFALSKCSLLEKLYFFLFFFGGTNK